MAIFSPPSLSWLGGEGGSGSDNGSDNGGGGGGGGSGAGGSPRADADAGADADAEFADVVGEMIEQEGQAMSPWWDPEAPPSHADDAEAPPPSPPSPPGGLSRAFTALGTVGTSLSSLFSKAPPPLLSGAPHQRAAVLSRSAPPAQPYQTLLPGVTAAAAAQSTAAAAAAAVDAAQATAPAAAGTTRGRRRSTLSGQRERQRQQVESATLALGSTWLQRKRWGRTEPTERGCWAAAGRPEVHARYTAFHPQATQRVGAPKVTGGGGGGGYGGGRRGGGARAENLARAAHAPSGEPARGAAERTHQSYPENGGTSIMHLCWVFTSPRTAPKLSIYNSRTTSTAPERRRR